LGAPEKGDIPAEIPAQIDGSRVRARATELLTNSDLQLHGRSIMLDISGRIIGRNKRP